MGSSREGGFGDFVFGGGRIQGGLTTTFYACVSGAMVVPFFVSGADAVCRCRALGFDLVCFYSRHTVMRWCDEQFRPEPNRGFLAFTAEPNRKQPFPIVFGKTSRCDSIFALHATVSLCTCR